MKMRSLAAALAAGVCVVWTATPAQAQARRFDIPAGSLRMALDSYGRQAGRPIIYRAEDVRGMRSAGYRGTVSPETALGAILEGTGLLARADSSGAVAIVRASTAQGEGVAGSAAAVNGSAEPGNAEIVVTGTNIRGVTPRSSPLTVITRGEMDARGAATAEQAINTLTQNFNSVNANGLAADRAGYANLYALNGVDLRGLGPGTTLVLLNGRRLAGSATGTVVDISLIPLPAVERIDVLTDSASSIYGSDAVGGVVNFILRDQFDGFEAAAAFGTTDDGAQDEFRAALTGGFNWSTGNLVASASYLDRSALTTDERDFSSGVGGLYNLSTPEERLGFFVSGRQEIGDRMTLTATGLYSRRTADYNLFRDLGVLPGLGPYQLRQSIDVASDSWFGSLGGTYRASEALTLDLVASYSRASNEARIANSYTIFPPLSSENNSHAETFDVTASASGRIAVLPGGDLAYAVGLGGTRETIDQITLPAPPVGAPLNSLRRSTIYAFGELNLPLVGPASAIRGLYRLEINLSARFSDYSDFGDNLSPKVGVLWALTEGFNLRGSYGRTFRAPYLYDLAAAGVYNVVNPIAFGYPDPIGSPAPIGLYLDAGTDPEIGPETSNLLALGMDLRPPSAPNLSFSLTYVSIDYTNRIARGDPGRGTGYLLQPGLYQILFNLAPTRDDFAAILASATYQPTGFPLGFDPQNLDALVGNIDYVVDNRLRNIAQSRQQAVDVSATYAFTRGASTWTLGVNATVILESEARTTPTSPLLSQINILGRPVDFRANAYAGFASGPFSFRITGNYVGPYENPFTPAVPRIGDWLTFDLAARYDFGSRSRGPLSRTSILLVVRNLLDADPPFVADIGPGLTDGLSEPIGYDPANASPFGRYLSIELRKRF